MVIGINIIPGVKAAIEIIVRDVTKMVSNVFNVRVRDIELMSVHASL